MPLVTSHNNDAVAEYVLDCFRTNAQHRKTIGIDDRILNNKRMMRGELSCIEEEAFGPGSPKRNIVQEKATDFEAAFTDIEFNIWEKPWALKLTPEPNVPFKAKVEMSQKILAELQRLVGTQQAVTKEALVELVRGFKEEAVGIIKEEGEVGVRRMDRRIYDQMAESDWVGVYSKFIADIALYPTAFIKGPINTINKKLGYAGNDVINDNTINPTVHRVSAGLIYPSPDSIDTQDGVNIQELFPVNMVDLTKAMKMEGFLKPQIREILGEFEINNKYDWWNTSNRGLDRLDSLGNFAGMGAFGNGYTVGLRHYSTLTGRQLKNGPEIKSKIKNDEIYNVEIWQVGDKVIRAVLIDEPDYVRPLHGTSYRKVSGSFWGLSIACLLEDNQLSVNALARYHQKAVKNASAPFKEVNMERFDPDDRESIAENGISAGDEYFVNQDPYGIGSTNKRAVEFYNFRDASQSILLSLQWQIRQSHTITGLQPQITGASDLSSVNRTASVFVQSANNSLKIIKAIAKNIDQDVVTKILQQYYKKNMQYSNDPSIKYDAQIITQGSAGIVEQEVMGNQFGFILQNIAQLIQLQVPGAQELYTIFSRKFLKHLGVDAGDWIPDHEKNKRLQAAITSAGVGVEEAPTSETGTATQQLDGRSVLQGNQQISQPIGGA